MPGEREARGKGIQKPAQHMDSLPFAMRPYAVATDHRSAGNDKRVHLKAHRSRTRIATGDAV